MERSPNARSTLVTLPMPVTHPDEAAPTTLPGALAPLVGRAAEIAAIRALLARADCRLITLTGAPGIGKTRLALAVAAAERDVTVVSLAPIRDPALVIPVLARALDVRIRAGTPPLAQLAAALRPRTALLVLDNFEHVVEAGPQVAELLAACPGLKALITSRSVLRVRGEHEFVVPPLALPDLFRPLPPAALGRCEAVAFFAQCARAILPDFCLSEANARAVAEICVRLEGLPLAIELAVPRLKLFSPDALRDRLERLLPWLTDGPRDLPARQRTLRDAIAWSHDLLDEDERRLFRRLGVFVGGWTLAAAARVCADADAAGDTVAAGVASLLDKSLVRRLPHPDEDVRFGMLETVREYALEQLAERGEADALRCRHAGYYADLAAETEPKLYGPEQAAWLERLEREHDNLRAALAWLLDRGEAEAALRLVGNLRNFWIVRDHLAEGQRWAEAALAAGPDAPAMTRARALSAAASFALRRGDYPLARAGFTEELGLLRTLGDKRHVAQTLLNLGQVANIEGEHAQAVALFEESMSLARAIGDRRTLARALNQLGEIARHNGDDARAAGRYEESLSLWRALGERERIAMVLHNLGPVVARLGEPQRAVALLSESLALSWGLRNTHGIAICLFAVAGVVAPWAPGPGARLLGAADTLRASIGVHWEPVDRAEFERSVAAVRARIGDAAFQTALAQGAALTMADAVACAREALALEPASRIPRAAHPGPAVAYGGLTRREREVVAQVALGRSNREIAAALSIAEKTVEMHVSNSLGKLGFRSRAQLAAWAATQGAQQSHTPHLGDR